MDADRVVIQGEQTAYKHILMMYEIVINIVYILVAH